MDRVTLKTGRVTLETSQVTMESDPQRGVKGLNKHVPMVRIMVVGTVMKPMMKK